MSQQIKHTRKGRVESNKMDKTAVVLLQSRIKHSIGKMITRSKRVKVHDPENISQVGDIVEIMSIRPCSKHKSWQIVRVIENS